MEWAHFFVVGFSRPLLWPYEASGKCCYLCTHDVVHYFLSNSLLDSFEYFDTLYERAFLMGFLWYAKTCDIYTQFYSNGICTGIWILSPGTGGLPDPKTKHSFIDISENNNVSNCHIEGNGLYNSKVFFNLTDFNAQLHVDKFWSHW
jgi:hypothetical protein